MPVLLRIALRNLMEHRARTLIVGGLIALGVLLLVVVNSSMDTVEVGMRAAFVEHYSGDVVIAGKSQGGVSLFGMMMNMGGEKMPTIPSYQKVHEKAASLQGLAGMTSLNVAYALAELAPEKKTLAILWGVEPQSYRGMFPASIEMVEGSWLEPGQEGLVVSTQWRDQAEKNLQVKVTAGSMIQLSGFAALGASRIRELPVRGVFRWRLESEGMESLAFVDVQTLRALGGMVLGTGADVELAPEQTELLTAGDVTALFEDDIEDITTSARRQRSRNELEGMARSVSPVAVPTDSGAWHFILLRLKNPAMTQAVIAELNAWFAAQKLDALAMDWVIASGPAAAFTTGIKTVFNVLVFIVAIAAVIIIMNTLVISVAERTAEIGTMRALGAQRNFVSKLFLLETMSISVIFGLLGMLVGVLVVTIAGAIGIPAANDIMARVLGAKVFRPMVSGGAITGSLVVMLFIGMVSSWYPVRVALRVSPVKAMQAE